jgi:hypothetical protein
MHSLTTGVSASGGKEHRHVPTKRRNDATFYDGAVQPVEKKVSLPQRAVRNFPMIRPPGMGEPEKRRHWRSEVPVAFNIISVKIAHAAWASF